MKILVTGSRGFIGKNFVSRINEIKGVQCLYFDKTNTIEHLKKLINSSDMIFHFAGINNLTDKENINKVNINLTKEICKIVSEAKKLIPIIFTSSTQINKNNLYGSSKIKAENLLKELNLKTGNPIYIFRCPNVFGKWSKPNYNSVVATFCYNITRNLPIKIIDEDKILTLIYIDDLISKFLDIVQSKPIKFEDAYYVKIPNKYKVSIKNLVKLLNEFNDLRKENFIPNFKNQLERNLYSCFISFIPFKNSKYSLVKNEDDRGSFTEVLKGINFGQFSFLSCKPGKVRGQHYHHSKIEKFYVIQGYCLFEFENIITKEKLCYEVSENLNSIIETIPGWAHKITNIGKDELLVLLWSSEVYDKLNPDTYFYKF